jgi:hypothetical protein
VAAVKPYVKTNKNDYIDAETISEPVGRPKMRFVPIKSDDQLDMQSLHRVGTAGRRIGRISGRRDGPQQRCSHGKAHQGNLLDLIDDDLLCDAPQLRPASIAQFRLGHADRTLMMRHHQREEIATDVAGWLDLHVIHHLRHRGSVLCQEGPLRLEGRGHIVLWYG